jgi:hypothetical protein
VRVKPCRASLGVSSRVRGTGAQGGPSSRTPSGTKKTASLSGEGRLPQFARQVVVRYWDQAPEEFPGEERDEARESAEGCSSPELERGAAQHGSA